MIIISNFKQLLSVKKLRKMGKDFMKIEIDELSFSKHIISIY